MAIDTAALEVFRAALRQREAAGARARAARSGRAWAVARHAADFLREAFGAGRVVVFGSLTEADGAFFDAHSDIDLAAWDIGAEDYFLAVARLQDLSPEFGIDLVAMERCPEHLRRAIEAGGIDL